MPADFAIEFENVSFSYGNCDAPVLDNVTFSMERGDFVALVGNNGSGKSTVAKLADAFLLPSSGEVRLFGMSTSQTASKGADALLKARRNVGFVFQNPNDQLVATTVADEVAFGPSNLGLPKHEVVARVEYALAEVGMLDCAGRDVNTLSGGQKQRIAIADSLAMRPELLILDEPTSMLDEVGRKDVLEIVKRLNKAGMAVLWVTHSANEAHAANRVLEISNGAISQTTASELERAHAKLFEGLRTLSTVRDRQKDGASDKSAADSASSKNPPIVFSNVSFAYSQENERGIDIFSSPASAKSVLENVNLDVAEGMLGVISGSNGSGKSTLVQHMNGLLKPTSGEVSVCGRNTSTKQGANAARRNVGICFQYPERSLFAQTVYDDIAFGPRSLGLNEHEVEVRTREAMEQLVLPFDKFAKRSPFDLSGGEQRKVSLAGVLAMRPKVLVMDEPFAGLDAPTHAHLLELVMRMKKEGQTIVLVTHDQGDIELLADYVYEL